MRAPENKSGGDLGFQIAPMIDVVFVIMLFFMVMASQVQVEYELRIKLPGEETPAEGPQELPDDLTIAISERGQVSINESDVDTPADKEKLPNLFAEVSRLVQNAKNAKTKLLVTLEPEETARYERIALVLDTLAAAGAAENVTFSIGEGDGE
ncbi:MAG: biopolymer transporter ExbD [Puniceicoccales bacterium]|jgi:biopolymer transport protein ExbD|nr:biopolymer transporter ExbD [Puniceicoccales bacterium]